MHKHKAMGTLKATTDTAEPHTKEQYFAENRFVLLIWYTGGKANIRFSVGGALSVSSLPSESLFEIFLKENFVFS